MSRILNLQGMADSRPADNTPATQPFSTISVGEICISSTASLSLCTP